jgi:hypothetical protein
MPRGKRVRPNIRVACKNCSTAQVRVCSGIALFILRLADRKSVSRGDEFRRQNIVHRRLLSDLRSSLNSLGALSDEDALQVLRTITGSEDPVATLASHQNMHQLPPVIGSLQNVRRLPPVLPMQAINGTSVPDDILPFQYELMMQHSNAFPAVAPLVHVAGDLSALEPLNQRLITVDPPESDPRLAGAKISRWTTVKIGETDARRLIGHYLETDHPIMGLFDADLFLEDLSSYSHAFCSDFLVTCILLWSCVCQLKFPAVCVRYADVCTAVVQL